jgi:L-lactate dehydrogenase
MILRGVHLKKGKVSVIGAGYVGSTTAYTLMIKGVISEIVLVDINKQKAEGDISDMSHGTPFVPSIKLTAGDYKDIEGSQIVIITAGAAQRPGETRPDLLKRNVDIFKNIVGEIVKYCDKDTILLVVTNPVDVLTYLTYKLSGFPVTKVIGSGTVLDSARLKYEIANHTNVDPRNVHAYILGEHGDSSVVAWSHVNIAGMNAEKFCLSCNDCGKWSEQSLYQNVKNSAYDIIRKKGATYYAIALAVEKIVESMIRDENSILTVSSFLDGQYGLSDVCLSVPAIVNASGIKRVIELSLEEDEIVDLRKSGEILKQMKSELYI